MGFTQLKQSNKDLYCMTIAENVNNASVEWAIVQSGVEGITGIILNEVFELNLPILDTLPTIALVYANTTARAAIYANLSSRAAIVASTSATILGAWG